MMLFNPKIVTTWLASRRGRDWSGTGPELVEALEQFYFPKRPKIRHWWKIPDYIGKGVREHLHDIEAVGWSVRFTRTARARTITFSRIEGSPKASPTAYSVGAEN